MPAIPYEMTIHIKNKTDSELEPVGTALYKHDGKVQQLPHTVPEHSSHSGGVFEKADGSKGPGLFGLVAYSLPDPDKILVIYIAMPSPKGTLDQCWVGLVPAGTSIDSDLAAECFSGPPKGFSQGKISWEFEKHGRDQLLIIEPVVADPHAYVTSSTVTLDLWRK